MSVGEEGKAALEGVIGSSQECRRDVLRVWKVEADSYFLAQLKESMASVGQQDLEWYTTWEEPLRRRPTVGGEAQ